jgi:hypothetical protein
LHDAGFGQKLIRVEETEGGKLDGTAKKKGLDFQFLREVGDNHFAKFIAAGTVENEAEGAFSIVLAHEHHRALEERAAQAAIIQEQLAFEIFINLTHTPDPMCTNMVILATGNKRR